MFKVNNKDTRTTLHYSQFLQGRSPVESFLVSQCLQMGILDPRHMKNGVFLIGIHSMQGWTATTRHGVTKKETQKD